MEKSPAAKIRIPGLSHLDREELAQEVDGDLIEFESEAMPGSQYGELLTTAVVIVTLAGLRVLATYLLRTSENEKIRKTLEIVNADGSKKVETIEIELNMSKAPQADVR